MITGHGKGFVIRGAMRTLIHIPIVHSAADMGTFTGSLKEVALRTIGKTGWRQKMKRIDQFWSEVDAVVLRLELPYPRVRLYQDGLPVCGHEREIVSELARKGSPNHRLLLDLTVKGALLMGTESAELLMEELVLQREIHAEPSPGEVRLEKRRRRSRGEDLLRRRDAFIARRIDETLQPNETGLLFLGGFHDVGGALRGDIRQLYPIGPPLPRTRKRRGT